MTQPNEPMEKGYVNPPADAPLSGSTSIPRLGEVQDGSAELASGLGHQASEVFTVFGDVIADREIPGVTQRRIWLNPGTFSGAQRPYYLLQQANGATAAVYIAAYGKDLYLSWKLFIRPVLNWILLAILAGASFLFGFLPLADEGVEALAGFLAAFFVLCLLVGFAGTFLKRNFLAFFFRELTLFDYEDIQAMCMITHQAMLQAADAVGIQVHVLSQKEQFYGGRRDRLI